MKETKTVFSLGIAALIVTVGLIIYVSIMPSTVDFRGYVEAVTYNEAEDTGYIEACSDEGVRLLIEVDDATKIFLSGGDDRIPFSMIKVGGMIDADFRKNIFAGDADGYSVAKKISYFPKAEK